MKFLQAMAGMLSGLAIAAALAAVPDISPAQADPAAQPAAASSTVADAPSGSGLQPPAAATGNPASWTSGVDAGSTPTQRAIVRAVRSSEHTSGVPAAAYTVRSIHVAQDPRWATAVLVPENPQELEAAVVLLRRDATGWQVADLGTFEIGCDIAPAGVLQELRLTCG